MKVLSRRFLFLTVVLLALVVTMLKSFKVCLVDIDYSNLKFTQGISPLMKTEVSRYSFIEKIAEIDTTPIGNYPNVLKPLQFEANSKIQTCLNEPQPRFFLLLYQIFSFFCFDVVN